MSPAACTTAGNSVRPRSGVSSPVGSLIEMKSASSRTSSVLRVHVVRIGVHRAQRVGHHRVDLHAGRVRRAHRRLDVAVVVQRVVDGEHLDAEPRQHLRVERDDVVGEQLERVEALPARQRVARRREALAQQPDALPRILVQVAHADVEHRAAEDVDVGVAGAVDRAEDRRHHRGRHARRPQALVRVAQRDVDEVEALSGHCNFDSGLHKQSAASCLHRGAVLDQHLHNGRALSLDRIHQLHHLDDADGVSGSTACPTSTNGGAPGPGAR